MTDDAPTARYLYAAFARRDVKAILDLHRVIADGDTVAVVGAMECRAKPTGRTYISDVVHVITVSNGKITRFQEFFDTYAAGEAFLATPPAGPPAAVLAADDPGGAVRLSGPRGPDRPV
jgi:ketosteroid isomerase-like protein